MLRTVLFKTLLAGLLLAGPLCLWITTYGLMEQVAFRDADASTKVDVLFHRYKRSATYEEIKQVVDFIRGLRDAGMPRGETMRQWRSFCAKDCPETGLDLDACNTCFETIITLVYGGEL